MSTSSMIIRVPSPPEHSRPPLQLFGWGMNDFGQLGLGPVDNPGAMFTKPKRNTWIEQRIEQGGVFGEGEGAGLEAIAAGGMHTLFIDERGTVIFSPFISSS
jgi:regulator of chromosome condensation